MNKLYQIEIDNRRGWKTCSACGLRKLILEYKIIKGKSLFNSNCQSCIKIKRKNYKFKNKETTKIKSAEYRKKNREIINAKNKIARITEKYKEWYKKWRNKNYEKLKIKKHEYYVINKENILKKQIECMKRKPEVYKKIRDKVKAKKKNDPRWILNSRISANLRGSLKQKKGGKSWQKILGYTLNDLIKHVESQFLEGMNWENIREWQIDHIIPCEAFYYESINDQQFKKCWALENLRPLWRTDNRKKWDYLPIGIRASFINKYYRISKSTENIFLFDWKNDTLLQ